MYEKTLGQDLVLALTGVTVAVGTAYGLQRVLQRVKPEFFEENDGIVGDKRQEVKKALKTIGVAVAIGLVANLTAQAVTSQIESAFMDNGLSETNIQEVFPTS